jgi:hypothetical protein
MTSILDTILENTLQNNTNTNNTKNSKKINIAIDTVCFQLASVSNSNNADICYIWEHFLSTLPSNKDNFNYEITLLERTKPNGSSYQFKKELNLETKFKIKQIPEFNYMCMNQDVDLLNNICKINKFDIFISSSFTYCNIIANIVIVYDMKDELHKQNKTEPITSTHQLIQKNKALLNASGFITFSKKTYTDLLDFYPHISKNDFPINIIKHNLNNTLSQKTLVQEDYKLHTLDTYLSTLETPLLKPQPFINIILQSYPETNLDRLKELKYCIRKNLENPYIKMVYDFGSGIDIFDDSDSNSKRDSDSDTFLKTKYKQISNTKWLTFEMAINFANTKHEFNTSNKREYWCIINLDIFLDDKSQWNTIRGQLNNGFIYAQSRHEFNILGTGTGTGTGTDHKIVASMDSNFAQLFHANTQDAWLFKTPINININNNKEIDFNFELGFLGCDNAIADRFVKAGYKVINQPITYKIFHYDIAKGKTSTNYLEKHSKETQEKTEKMIKPKNKYPERIGSYLVPNYDQMLSMTGGKDIDLIGLINNLGGCSNFERYEFISKLFSDRIIITNP